ncbi:MAG: hypothetical protein ABFD90_07630 [Phycisphaerales bacterium]
MAQRSRVTHVDAVAVVCCVILALLTLGAAERAGRRLALEQACLSNVEVLTDAWLTYADEHDGELVSSYPSAHSGWVRQAQISEVVPTLEQKLAAIREGDLFSYVGDLNVYHCPADQRLNDPNQMAFGSFSIAGGANGMYWPGYVRATQYAEIENPSAKYIFVEEADPRGENIGAWEMNLDPLEWVDPLAMWHEESSTLGFADGHGDVHGWHDQSLIDLSYMAMYEPSAFGFSMTPPTDETRDIEFMRDGFPCRSPETDDDDGRGSFSIAGTTGR